MFRFESNKENQIAEDIYLYENFYPDYEEIKDYLEKNDDDSFWNSHFNLEEGDLSNTFWESKLSRDFLDNKFHDHLLNFVAPKYWNCAHGNFMRIKNGDSIYSHVPNIPKYINYIIGYYMGDFTGGEIVFPELDFKYAPKENDLIIFSNMDFIVKEVKSGIKYSYLDYLFEHPGYVLV